MMKWIVLFCSILSGPSLAQQINVRSGAHEGFARLVLDAPVGTTWELESEPDKAMLRLNGHSGGFDISEVFDRIDRSFISAVSADNNGIEVTFACRCRANVFSQGSRMIVLDVLASPEPEPLAQSQDLALEFVGGRALQYESNASAPVPQTMPENDVAPDTVVSVAPQVGWRASIQTSVPDDTEMETSPDLLRNTQESLVREIGIAATRGILSPAVRKVDLKTASMTPQIDTRVFEPSPPILTRTPTTAPTGSNIRITSSSDIAPDSGRRPNETTALGIPCLDPARITVQDWGSDVGLAGQIATLRGRLFGEFDRLDRQVAVELVQTYLYYGFGAEARQVLLLDDDLAQSYPQLMSIADIMEYGYGSEASYLRHFMDCDSEVALWAILSAETLGPGDRINIKAALRAVSALPMHLRSFLAPGLSQRFLSYGEPEAAAAALRSLERAAKPLSPRAKLAKADLELAAGDVLQAQERLADVVNSNAEQSAEALIKFVDSRLDQDTEIEENIATLVEAYAMEMRDDPIGEELRRTHVLALGKSSQFDAAFDALSRVRARNADQPEDTLRSSILELLTRNADDIEFLDHAFTQMAITPDTLSQKTRLLLAERLLKLGFPGQAEIILDKGADNPRNSATALLSAEIALALSRPQDALTHLIGEKSDAADALRAEAEARAGDFAGANVIYNTLGDINNSRRTAWLSTDWSVLIEETSPVFGPVVQVARRALETPGERDGMLERAASAISESQGARLVIEDLLRSDDQAAIGRQ